MLSQNTGNEQLSNKFLALTEISNTPFSQLEFSQLFAPVIRKIVSLVKQTNVDSTMFCDQSAGVFRA